MTKQEFRRATVTAIRKIKADYRFSAPYTNAEITAIRKYYPQWSDFGTDGTIFRHRRARVVEFHRHGKTTVRI